MIGSILLMAATIAAPNLGAGISPAVVSGPAHSSSAFTITDAGNVPEHIVIQVIEMRPVKGSKLFVPYGEYAHYRVSTPEFNLTRGQHRTVTVTINSPDGYAHALAVFAESSIAGKATGIARVHAEVAARYVVTGKPNPYAPGAVSVPKPHSTAGLPVLPIGAGVALLAILLAAWGVFRRRSRRTSKPEPESPYGFIP